MKKIIFSLILFLLFVQTVSAGSKCWFDIADEPGISQEKMKVYYGKTYAGEANILKIGCRAGKKWSWPEVFVLYSSGYVRMKNPQVPDNRFGSSFILGPGYWENGIYYHNPQIKEVRLGKKLTKMRIKAENNDFSMQYDIKFKPKEKKISAKVKQTIIAEDDIKLDADKIASGESFKIVQLSSMFINGSLNDMEYVSYKDNSKNMNRINLSNQNRFIFQNPVKLKKSIYNFINLPDREFYHAPSVSLMLKKPKYAVAQGYVAKTFDPNQDNVGFWISDNTVDQNIEKYSKFKYSYSLTSY